MYIESDEAQAHFAELLERVAHGGRIIITQNGVPIAELSPVGTLSLAERYQAIAKMKALRQERCLGGSLRALLEEGRR